MENSKNYKKSKGYIRYESALGLGLITSSGEKWKRDRQKIQPMFKRELIEGYYYEVVSAVAEKYKERWLKLTENGTAEIDLSQEMAAITIEVVLKVIFGKDNLDEATVASLYKSSVVLMEYVKSQRLLPKVDMRRMLRTAASKAFQRELLNVETLLAHFSAQYRAGALTDKYNILALLIEAQKEYPDSFSERDIRDHSISMVFAGFETTSLLMQWMWFVLDGRPEIEEKACADILAAAPNAATDSMSITYEQTGKMDYLFAVIKETMRVYPPFWVISREAVEDDMLGDYKIEKGTTIVLPQIIMQRHPKWWVDPNAFIPERFLDGNEEKIDDGCYFPFSQGPRKCSAYKFAEMEGRLVFTKLLPLFRVKVINAVGNGFNPGISLKPQYSIRAQISRR